MDESFYKETVVVIENCDLYRRCYCEALKVLGFSNILEIDDTEVALDKIAQTEDVVLIVLGWDILPRRWDALDIVEHVRELPEKKQLPIVAVVSGLQERVRIEPECIPTLPKFCAVNFDYKHPEKCAGAVPDLAITIKMLLGR